MFSELIGDLVTKFGSQAEAARKSGLSKALISDTLKGKGPEDPHTDTWNAVFAALGRPLIRGKDSLYDVTPDDRTERLKRWMVKCPHDVAEVIYRTAQIHGFEKDDKL